MSYAGCAHKRELWVVHYVDEIVAGRTPGEEVLVIIVRGELNLARDRLA
jgi:hypothetical protein